MRNKLQFDVFLLLFVKWPWWRFSGNILRSLKHEMSTITNTKKLYTYKVENETEKIIDYMKMSICTLCIVADVHYYDAAIHYFNFPSSQFFIVILLMNSY